MNFSSRFKAWVAIVGMGGSHQSYFDLLEIRNVKLLVCKIYYFTVISVNE